MAKAKTSLFVLLFNNSAVTKLVVFKKPRIYLC